MGELTVSFTLGINKFASGLLSENVKIWISKRFTPLPRKKEEKNQPAFDLLRASVNLVVSSALIALGTSLVLPLSTTYVTFMVAMGTSLSDGAWDRESAVFRITGVFSVIGGWFFTAISAFTISFILASLFFHGGIIAIFVMISMAAFIAYRTHKIHLKKGKAEKASKAEEETVNPGNIKEFCIKKAQEFITKSVKHYNQIITETKKNDKNKLRNIRSNITLIQKEARMHRKTVSQVLKKAVEQEAMQAYFAIRTMDNIMEIINCLENIAGASFNHLANHHKQLTELQLGELKVINEKLTLFLNGISQIVSTDNTVAMDEIELLKTNTENEIEHSSINEVKRIREELTGNRSSILFMNILQETRNILHFSSQVMKSLIK